MVDSVCSGLDVVPDVSLDGEVDVIAPDDPVICRLKKSSRNL